MCAFVSCLLHFEFGSCVCSVCTILFLHSKSAGDTSIRPFFYHKQDTGLYIGFTGMLLTSGSYIWILALSGLVSGICYNNSILKVHRILCVPSWVAKIFSWTLEPIFSSAEPTNEVRVGMGATVDIQRQQRMELLDRQIMMSQVAQMRRQRQQQGGMINWNRLFPPLRHRHNANYQDHRPSEQDTPPPTEVSEEQVARLMEMGFSRGDALEALRASNNDLNVATNFLLQH
ncbi:Ubac2 [Columba guinea]|nr:Ubac2 [Columba guinea]